MKRNIFCWIAILFTIPCFSQNIEELDKRNGFKEFKIGDPISKYSKYLTNPTGQLEKYITYKYASDKLTDYSVFGKSFDGIMLAFDKKDKLSTVFLLKNYDADNFQNSLDDYKIIMSSLMSLFGKPTKDKSNDESSITYYWTGSSISLYYYHTYKGASVGSNISIMILNNSFDSKKIDF